MLTIVDIAISQIMAAQHVSVLLTLALVCTCAWSYVILKPKAYVRLNSADGTKKINASTYNGLAFDYTTNMLYVVGE